MSIYLPIAEMAVPIIGMLAILIVVTATIVFLGSSGSILLPSLLYLFGMPAAVGVATCNVLVTAAALPGLIMYMRRGNIDRGLAMYLLMGGIVGVGASTLLVSWLNTIGQYHLFFAVTTSAVLLIAAFVAIGGHLAARSGKAQSVTRWKGTICERIPLRLYFPTAMVYLNPLLPIGIGILSGLLMATTGTSAEVLLVPVVAYCFAAPINVSIGTTLLVITGIGSVTVMFQHASGQTVDPVLFALLVVGVAAGTAIGARLSNIQISLRARLVLLALILLLVALRSVYGLLALPGELYSRRETI